MITPADKGLPIITQPAASLRDISKPVDKAQLLSGELNTFFAQLYKSMIEDDGVGIAAPQVGRNIRVCIVSDAGKNPLILVNPEITWVSRDTVSLTEGCLSVPGVWGPVVRPKSIHVKSLAHDGATLKMKAKGWLARVIQHEIDHLDGILFIDKAEWLETSDERHSKL